MILEFKAGISSPRCCDAFELVALVELYSLDKPEAALSSVLSMAELDSSEQRLTAMANYGLDNEALNAYMHTLSDVTMRVDSMEISKREDGELQIVRRRFTEVDSLHSQLYDEVCACLYPPLCSRLR